MANQALLSLPLEKTLGPHQVSQAFTTPGKNNVRIVRMSRRSAVVLTEDLPDLEIVFTGTDRGDLPFDSLILESSLTSR